MRSGNARVRPVAEEVLSDDWYVLRKATFDFQGRDGMEDLVEDRVAHAAAARELDERQGHRLTRHRDVPGPEDIQGRTVHRGHVGRELAGVVVGSGAVRACHKHEEGSHVHY